jgi:hypothetical protein
MVAIPFSEGGVFVQGSQGSSRIESYSWEGCWQKRGVGRITQMSELLLVRTAYGRLSPRTYSPKCVEVGFCDLLHLSEFLGSPRARCGIGGRGDGARLCCLDLHTMGDAACEGPPFPSRLLSKHIPSAKKTPVCGICKGCRRVTARYNLVEPGSPISPLQGGPAFLLAASRSRATSFLCTPQVPSDVSYIRR